MARRTKIIATVGPASLGNEVLAMIINQGADFIRINKAYSDDKQNIQILEQTKKYLQRCLSFLIFVQLKK
jgi:pyruvate kinase